MTSGRLAMMAWAWAENAFQMPDAVHETREMIVCERGRTMPNAHKKSSRLARKREIITKVTSDANSSCANKQQNELKNPSNT